MLPLVAIKKMKVIQIICFLLICQIGNSQFIACDYSWAESYEVTANSGLKLRKEQSLKSEVVGVIPFKSEIKLCYQSTKTEVIDGIKGKWVKAFWQDKEGFVFDGYTKKLNESSKIKIFNTEMDLVNRWENTGLSKDEVYYGLYKTHIPNFFEFRKIELNKNEITKNHSTPIDYQEIPIWVFTGLNIKESKKIKGTLVNRMLCIGDKQGFDMGVIYGDGKAIKGDSTTLGVYKEINPYELRVQTRKNEKIIDQLLLKMKCWGGMAQLYGYEAKSVVNFIGDLDGDNKDDILITYQTTYKGWYYGLFSTKYATGNEVFKALRIGQGSE